MKEPNVRVGILCEPQIEFVLLNRYQVWGTYANGVITYHTIVNSKQVVAYDNGKVLWNGRQWDQLSFEPIDPSTDAFELIDVTIGINFHWERKENQRFLGALKIIVENEKLTAINVLSVEDYLTSVISSEMSATASLELLKAHAVISRSWLLANLSPNPSSVGRKTKTPACQMPDNTYITQSPLPTGEESGERLLWYERDAHTRFDVCADDHCQRYQGITRTSTDIVKQAIDATRGQVLIFEGKICDARFSKCCGGMLEEFQYCWEDVKHPYLSAKRDPFCNTKDKKILSQVLNNYDQETIDFYRWKVEYTQQELSELIKNRSGIDYGQIIDLVPVARGTSGRLWKLKIVGTLRTLTIGKELEIRRTLSPSHLYSSAFAIDKEDINEGIPGRFILTGSGWGHGVGLCQIGAAVMGEQGYSYDSILLHYYTGASIEKRY